MPIRKFRTVAEMEGNTWKRPGDPELFEAIRATWELARLTLRPSFPPGYYRHRSIEEAQAQRDRWERAVFESYQARLPTPTDRRCPPSS